MGTFRQVSARPRSTSWRALALFAAGDAEAALTANEGAVGAMEASPFPWLLHAALLVRLGRVEEAYESIARLREIAPRLRLRHAEAALRAQQPWPSTLPDEITDLLRTAGLD